MGIPGARLLGRGITPYREDTATVIAQQQYQQPLVALTAWATGGSACTNSGRAKKQSL